MVRCCGLFLDFPFDLWEDSKPLVVWDFVVHGLQ